MKIQILGTGCAKCQKLKTIAEIAAMELKLDFDIEKISDINEIESFGVVVTPALAIDGNIKYSGKIPSAEEMKKLLLS